MEIYYTMRMQNHCENGQIYITIYNFRNNMKLKDEDGMLQMIKQKLN